MCGRFFVTLYLTKINNTGTEVPELTHTVFAFRSKQRIQATQSSIDIRSRYQNLFYLMLGLHF